MAEWITMASKWPGHSGKVLVSPLRWPERAWRCLTGRPWRNVYRVAYSDHLAYRVGDLIQTKHQVKPVTKDEA